MLNGDARASSAIAKALGLKHRSVLADGSPLAGHEGRTFWKNLVAITESPYCGPEQLYKFQMNAAIKKFDPLVKVLMSGQGSDEFNGGYSPLFSGENGTWDHFSNVTRELYRRGLHNHSQNRFSFWDQISSYPLLDETFMKDSNLAAERAYFQTKYRDLQMYNLWNEDRVSSYFALECRVPFLDHRIVELTMGLKPNLRENLFWNKNILRLAAQPYLPAEFSKREKVPFFYGKGIGHVAHEILDLLSSDGFALIEEAFSHGAGRDIINVPSLRDAIASAQKEKNPSLWQGLLRLVNLGILESHVLKGFTTESLNVPTITLDHTHGDSETLARMVKLQAKPTLTPFSDLMLNTEYECMVSVRSPDTLFVTKSGVILYEINQTESPLLFRILNQVGIVSVVSLIHETGSTIDEINAAVSEALEENVLKLSEEVSHEKVV